jgi:hypothetical protein
MPHPTTEFGDAARIEDHVGINLNEEFALYLCCSIIQRSMEGSNVAHYDNLVRNQGLAIETINRSPCGRLAAGKHDRADIALIVSEHVC